MKQRCPNAGANRFTLGPGLRREVANLFDCLSDTRELEYRRSQTSFGSLVNDVFVSDGVKQKWPKTSGSFFKLPHGSVGPGPTVVVMNTSSFLVFSGIVPHPPIMVPEIGRDAIAEVKDSVAAMKQFTERLIASGAQTVVLISPHAPLEVDSFVAYNGPTLFGDFGRFGAPETEFSLSVDDELLTTITATAALENFRITRLGESVLDHGCAVPMYFLLTNGWTGKVVALGYSFLSNSDHLRFGYCIRRAIDKVGKPAGFVASGDLSHRLKPSAPAGYNPGAHRFDEEVVAAISDGKPDLIPAIDYSLRKLAGECGYRSMLVAIGAGNDLPVNAEVMSYEAPFGVGYMVAQLTSTENQVTDSLLAQLARQSVEQFINTGVPPVAPNDPKGILAERAPCFVSLKTRDGELRGCIGTVEPAKNNLAEELIANAVSAATQDPRFQPVTPDELKDLRYSVDVLLPPESTTIEDLDPAIYGVIVEDDSGDRRGLLLPDIPGVDDAKQQVDIAMRKAGIARGTAVRLFRFRVERFRESNVR